jgi:2'-5' RNA ligase
MMRLFIVARIPENVKISLLEIQARIKAQSSKGNFTRPENLHLTLAFLGETPEDHVPLIHEIIAGLRADSFDLSLTRAGFFSHSGKELWWIGAQEGGRGLVQIKELRQKLADGLHLRGISFDDRPFAAHITLGREIRHLQPINAGAVNINFPVRRLCLMKSEHIDRVLVHTELFKHSNSHF